MNEAEQKWLSDCFFALARRTYIGWAVTWTLLLWILLKLYGVV